VVLLLACLIRLFLSGFLLAFLVRLLFFVVFLVFLRILGTFSFRLLCLFLCVGCVLCFFVCELLFFFSFLVFFFAASTFARMVFFLFFLRLLGRVVLWCLGWCSRLWLVPWGLFGIFWFWADFVFSQSLVVCRASYISTNRCVVVSSFLWRFRRSFFLEEY